MQPDTGQTNMASKRSRERNTLHGVDTVEKSSPLKKQLGKLRSEESNILRDGNYVDIGWETVLTSKPKQQRTARVKSRDCDHINFTDGDLSCQMAIDLFPTEENSQKVHTVCQGDCEVSGICEMDTSNEFLEVVQTGSGEYSCNSLGSQVAAYMCIIIILYTERNSKCLLMNYTFDKHCILTQT